MTIQTGRSRQLVGQILRLGDSPFRDFSMGRTIRASFIAFSPGGLLAWSGRSWIWGFGVRLLCFQFRAIEHSQRLKHPCIIGHRGRRWSGRPVRDLGLRYSRYLDIPAFPFKAQRFSETSLYDFALFNLPPAASFARRNIHNTTDARSIAGSPSRVRRSGRI